MAFPNRLVSLDRARRAPNVRQLALTAFSTA